MNQDKNKYLCHPRPETGMASIHQAYGLWVFSKASYKTLPDSFLDCKPRYFEFYAISHMYAGYGHLWTENGIDCDVHAGECITITPGTLNRYGGWHGESFCEDTLNFTGPVADQLMRSGILTNGISPLGPVRKLLPIMELLQDPAVDSQIRANLEVQKLLVELYLNRREKRTEYPLVEKLITEIKSHPERWWTVSEMAEMCSLSDDQLRRVFLRNTGSLPKEYLERVKFQQACELLTTTALPVTAVAARLGYQDSYHFSRRFKAVIGMPPIRYRQINPNHPYPN